jgi:hypothetical protein
VDKRRRPELTVKRILELADAYHARTGDWPTAFSSWLPGDRELTWRRVDNALRYGLRGLPGGDYPPCFVSLIVCFLCIQNWHGEEARTSPP